MGFEESMHSAQSLLQQRDLEGTVRETRQAKHLAQTPEQEAQALQIQGIALRIDRHYAAAKDAFKTAESLAVSDQALLARIRRDYGMVYIDLAEAANNNKMRNQLLSEAMNMFASSRILSEKVGEELEAEVTHGFMGRAWLIGEKPKTASHTLEAVHFKLTGKHDVYEMNNLVWLARSSVAMRLRYARRAFQLSHNPDNRARLKEYIVVLVGGNRLYKLIKRTQHQ